MSWTIKRADSLGVEIFTEAEPQGRKFYLRGGFRDMLCINVDMSHGEDTIKASVDCK